MKIKLVLSAVMGFFFGLLGYFVLILFEIEKPAFTAFLVGVMFAATLMLVLIASEERDNKKYAQLERRIASTVFCKTQGNFNLGNDTRAGRVYICDDGMFFISIDKKPHLFDGIEKGQISRYEVKNHTTIDIYTTDFRKYVITVPEPEKLLKYMDEDLK